jgi:hypothetical protein
MIELGAGFDMDLTARENIYLNGAVLGYSREFMTDRFEEIINFSELMDFVDEAFRVQKLFAKSNGKRRHGRNHSKNVESFESKSGNDFWGQSGYPRDSKKSNNHRRNSSQLQDSIVPRAKFFPQNSVKEVHCNPDGNSVAYIAKNNSTGLDSIHIIPVLGTNSFANVISDNVHIKSMRYAGSKYLVYTCVGEDGHVKLMCVNLKTKERKDISPVEGAVSVRVVATGESAIITLSYDGNNYTTNKINLSNGSSIIIKQDVVPIAAIFDANLVPRVLFKNITTQSVDVFVNDGSKSGRQIDQIDPRIEKYITTLGNKCFKLRLRRNGNESDVDLLSLDWANNSQNTVVIKDVQDVSDCDVQFTASGDPLLIRVNKGKITNSPIHSSAQRSINHLNRSLGENWRIVDSTPDGGRWLLCVSNPQKPNEYWHYDLRNTKLKRMIIANEALSNEKKLRAVDYVKIPSKDGSYIRGYLIKSQRHSAQSPLMVIVNSRRFGWEFAPLAQLIANRGCSVLCLNCRTDYDNNDGESEFRRWERDIIEAVEWCFKNRIASVGNVSLLGREKGALPVLNAFTKCQKYYTGCVLLSPPSSDENEPLITEDVLNHLNKPLCLISRINESEQSSDSSSTERTEHITHLEYNQKPGNDVIAGLVEKIISVLYPKDVYVEKMSAKSMSGFTTIVDGVGILADGKTDGDFGAEEKESSAYDIL